MAINKTASVKYKNQFQIQGGPKVGIQYIV